MKLTYCLFFTFLMLTSFCQAHDTAEKRKTFLISHASHPDIDGIHDLLAKVYQQLGFKVEFLPTPTKRGLLLVIAGVVDADSVRGIKGIAAQPNLIRIDPPFSQVVNLLVCKTGIPCKKDVLFDKNATILINRGAVNDLSQKHIIANLVINEKFDIYLDLIRAGRYHYAIYPTDKQYLEKLQQEFNLVELNTSTYHHVVNKKHRALVPEIEKLLKKYQQEATDK